MHTVHKRSHIRQTQTHPHRVTEVTWCGLCKVCLLADGAQVSRGRGDKHTTETQVSHPLALTTLTAGAHSAHTQDRFPPALCYTQEHSCLIPPEESGTITTHMQQTTTLSQGHTHTDTQIHADSSTETPHTHTDPHRQVYAHGGSRARTHTPGLPHIQTLFANRPHKLRCHLAPCASLADTHRRLPPTSV